MTFEERLNWKEAQWKGAGQGCAMCGKSFNDVQHKHNASMCLDCTDKCLRLNAVIEARKARGAGGFWPKFRLPRQRLG